MDRVRGRSRLALGRCHVRQAADAGSGVGQLLEYDVRFSQVLALRQRRQGGSDGGSGGSGGGSGASDGGESGACRPGPLGLGCREDGAGDQNVRLNS